MSQIKIDLDLVENLNGNVKQNIYKISNVSSSVSSLTYHVDSAITARRNIRSRLQRTSQSLRELETRLKELNSFIKNSIDSYSRSENDLSRKAQTIGDRKVTLEELFTSKSDRYTTEQLNNIWNQLSEDDRKTISKQFSENWFKQVLKDIGNDIAYAAETSWDSFGEIGNDFLNGLQTRADKALDSPYDFINWLTIGASGGIYEGAKDRADHMWDSSYDFFNWLTVGAVETVDESFTPDKPLSKEHWLASLGVVSFLYGGAKGQLGAKVGNGLTAEEISAGSTTLTQSSEQLSWLERSQDKLGISFKESLDPILNKHNLTLSEFNELRLKSAEQLSTKEVEMIKDIRRSVESPSYNTIMQKVLPENAKGWLFESPKDGGQIRLGGYVAKALDTKALRTFDGIYEGLRLDYESNPYIGGDTALLVRYKAGNPNDYKIPFGGKNAEAVDRMTNGDTASDFIATEQKSPFTGNGFTESKDHIVPEYRNDAKTPVQDGAELYEITNQGERIIGVYNAKVKRFIAVN
ncbi:hypothetical protein QFZ81_000163 [Paenibacillus sp. V4I9]|uniref:hypothetical protein n=1 Tax=Paenibacillus sp. V4I9 TaxID=3042308 RepID=UPI0027838765|nr:hypothetical protein [Paenibacillus sp. V4I9]MDQ0885075.1 hypothetical protein [Paenibacillus sp. V4I9]